MKNINILFVIILCFLLTTSCKKQLDLKNPNAPTQISIETPRAAMSNITTGELARLSSMLTQQMSYGTGDNSYQPLYENYQVTNGDYKYVYEQLYNKVLISGKELEGTSNETEAKLLQGLAYVYLNDFFSNPYKLGEGKIALTDVDVFNVLDPIIDGGGTYAAVAKLVKAKYFLSQENYADALLMVTGFVEADNYEYTTAGSINNNNNWPLFALNRPAYMASDTFSASLFEASDTLRYRASFGYSANENISNPVQINSSHELGFIYSVQKVEILGFLEAKFIEAECIARTGGDASLALNEAISYSYTKLGVSATPPVVGGTLDDVKTEKFKAMLGHPSIMIDFRRWENDATPFISGFQEKVVGGFPEKQNYIVQ